MGLKRGIKKIRSHEHTSWPVYRNVRIAYRMIRENLRRVRESPWRPPWSIPTSPVRQKKINKRDPASLRFICQLIEQSVISAIIYDFSCARGMIDLFDSHSAHVIACLLAIFIERVNSNMQYYRCINIIMLIFALLICFDDSSRVATPARFDDLRKVFDIDLRIILPRAIHNAKSCLFYPNL